MGLKERLEELQRIKVAPGADPEEIELRARIKEEEARIVKERRAARTLQNERILEEFRDDNAPPGVNRQNGRPIAFVDLDPDGARPETVEYGGLTIGVASRYVVINPLKEHYNAWQDAAKRANGNIAKLRTATETFVRQSLIFPKVETEADNMCLSRTFELFGGDVDVLFDEITDLHGVKTKADRKSG